MKQSRVTIRYAKALLQLAIEQNTLEQSYNDMVLLDAVCTDSKELSLLLKSPIVKTDHKLGEVSMAFINIITTKKRESLLALIARSFIALYKEHNKIETATVTTAAPLDEALRAEVINFIKKYGDDNVELTEKVDEKIIGGAIIRMGDKQLDASVSKAISELRQTFNKNLYIQDF
jgi:F-type H+-transporting ATPase subunit delta